jgi:hypothetical protein
MNERERLIELLCNIPPMNINIGGRRIGKHRYTMSHIADYLLANGVTVYPVKAGDTVYRIVTQSAGERYKKTGACKYERYEATKHFIREVRVTKNNFLNVLRNLGETVFRSYEEAKAALSERTASDGKAD